MTRWNTSALAAAVALTLGLGASLAQAQPRPPGPPGHAQGHGPDRHDHRDMRRPGPPPHAHGGRHGAGPNHDWVRGSRVPPQYRTRHYVVNDWRSHRLPTPPRGYQWVQNGSDYLMVAIATGVIAQVILNH